MCLQNSEIECFKVHIRRLEDKVRWFPTNVCLSLHVIDADIDIDPPQNEKLTVERAFSEDSMSKLRKVNNELRVGQDGSFGLQICGLE